MGEEGKRERGEMVGQDLCLKNLCLKKCGQRVAVSVLFLFSFLSFSASPVHLFPYSPLSHLPVVSAAPDNDAVVSIATREGRLAVFDDAWQTIHDRYYDPGFHGVDWEDQKITFRNMAADTNNREELYAILRRMIVSLDDPHTRVYSSEEKFDWWSPR